MDTDAVTNILQTTHHAFHTYDYADLTLQNSVAVSASNATIRHYFDSKSDHFTAALNALCDQYIGRIASVFNGCPRERLQPDGCADPALTAEFLTATIRGAHTRDVSIDSIGSPGGRLHEDVRWSIDTQLVNDPPKVIH